MSSPHYDFKSTPTLPRIPERAEQPYKAPEGESEESESDDE